MRTLFGQAAGLNELAKKQFGNKGSYADIAFGGELDVTMEGTGDATAFMYPDKIIVDAAAAEAAKYIELETPYYMEVIGIKVIKGNNTDCEVALYNGADAISDAIDPGANDLKSVPEDTLDDSKWSFEPGDDDLRLEVTTGAFTGRAVIFIRLTKE